MDQPLTILITGAAGQIGRALCRVLAPRHQVVALDRASLDLTKLERVRAAVSAVAPDVVINAAGYTAVDNAEREPDLARRLNAEAPAVVAESARRAGAILVHYSTDYVFDGSRPTPYQPDDPTCPLGVYGRTKLDGEIAVRASGVPALVLRTAWIYAATGRNFLRTMLRLAEDRDEIRVVDDQIGSPTSADVVAVATARALDVAACGRPGARELGDRAGTYHVTCRGQTTWYDFARAIFETMSVAPLPRLVPITSAQYPTIAMRPPYSVLDVSRFEQAFDLELPAWRDALVEVTRQLEAGVPDGSPEGTA